MCLIAKRRKCFKNVSELELNVMKGLHDYCVINKSGISEIDFLPVADRPN